MEKSIRIINESEQEAELILTNEELQPYYDQAYQKAIPHINIPGFRKGKVPMSMIKQRFGKEIENEAIEDIANEIFQKIVEEEKLEIVGNPHLHDIEKSESGIKLVVHYHVIPEFDLVDYKQIHIKEPVHNVSEEEIEKRITDLLRTNGTFEVDNIINDEFYVVGIKLQEADEQSGLPIIGGKSEETHIYLADQVVLPELRNMLIGLSVGDTFTFKPSQHDQFAPETNYQVTVNDIQKLVPQEFTNEFVSRYTKEKFETTEEFREEIGFNLQEEWNRKSREEMEKQIEKYLVEAHNFKVPPQLTARVLIALKEDFKKKYSRKEDLDYIESDAFYKNFYNVADRIAKWEVIRKRIIEKEGLGIEDFDIDSIVENEADRLKSNKDSIKEKLMQNNAFVASVLTKKMFDLILDFAVTSETTFEELEEEQESQNPMFQFDSIDPNILDSVSEMYHDHDHDHHHHHDHDHDHHDHDHDHKH